MARIRTIKPEFFQHESLYDAERESGLPLRIAFAGLWTVADKLGRFECRPRALKLNVLPYDECDFSAVLSALEKHGFLQRYVVEGKEYCLIPSWDKHQHINVREPDSTIPAPVEAGTKPRKAGTKQVPVPAQDAGKGREGKGKEDALAEARAVPGLDIPAFDRWEAYRVSKRKPLSPESLLAAAEEMAKLGAGQAAAVQHSISNGYQGLFPPKDQPLAAAVNTPIAARPFPS